MDFVPLITLTQCKIAREDRILGLILPRRAALQTFEKCETKFSFLESNLDNVAGVIIAPLWYDGNIQSLPDVLLRLGKRGIPVLVVGNTARFNDVPRAIRNLVISGVTQVAKLNYAVTKTRWDESATNSVVRSIAEQHDTAFLDRESVVCPTTGCELTQAYGSVTLFDSGHWTLNGAKQFAPRIIEDGAMREFMRQVMARRR